MIMTRRKGILLGLAALIPLTGCAVLEPKPKANLEETPPYYQSEEQSMQMRAYHDKDIEEMSGQMHAYRSKGMKNLEKANKQAEKDRLWEEDYQKTLEKREKRKFSNWFKNGDKTFMMSDEAKKINNNLER
jgi:outer membrane biogenesis lipoprotein LolB